MFALTALLVPMAGCSKPAPLKIAAAEGIVTINGKPAENILVQFLPQVGPNDPGPTSTGVTDASGKFRLTTADGKDGALVGPCKILLADLNEERPPQGKPATKLPRVPTPYLVLGPNTPEVQVAPENKPFEITVRS